MLGKKKYIRTRAKYFGETGLQAQESYKRYKEHNMKINGMKASEVVIDDYNCRYIMPKTTSTSICTSYGWSSSPFAPFEPQACNPVPCQKPIGNNPMYVDNDKHIESSKINYLTERASHTYYNAQEAISTAFHLENDPAPMTAAEFVKRIQDGKFLLNDETKNKSQYEPARYIQWRDPAFPADFVGAKASREVLDKLFQDTKDTIAIGTPAEGLAAVKTLDAWTPTVGNA